MKEDLVAMSEKPIRIGMSVWGPEWEFTGKNNDIAFLARKVKVLTSNEFGVAEIWISLFFEVEGSLCENKSKRLNRNTYFAKDKSARCLIVITDEEIAMLAIDFKIRLAKRISEGVEAFSEHLKRKIDSFDKAQFVSSVHNILTEYLAADISTALKDHEIRVKLLFEAKNLEIIR
jgi:hypothetical protein